ncbi:MAG TPA: S16 family serine protease [Actinomycetota bacterium]|nr:S16 family serine protease [Actinomycetota bacterium]
MRTRSRWFGVGLGLGVLALVLAAIAWPLPLYSEGPGPARDVLPRIIYDGMPRYEPTGQLDLTTVRYQQLTGVTALRAWLDDTEAIVKADVLYPPDVPVTVTQQRGVSQMDQSQIDATAVALHALHTYPKDHGDGALIDNVVAACPADGKLYPGDIITSVDGQPVHTAAQASKLFDKIPDDQPLHFELDVDGNSMQETFTRAPCGPKKQKLVGISMIDAFPIDVTYTADEIGGPSAGLMWALGLYELLTPDDITAGRTIAGTGEISPDGTVYPIGGIQDKVVAAQRAGAAIFLAPKDNMGDLAGVDTGDMQVISVKTFDDALRALQPSVATG